MDSNEYLKQQLKSLQDAINLGICEMEFQGKKTKFRSLDEMRRIEQNLLGKINNRKGFGIQKIVSVYEKY